MKKGTLTIFLSALALVLISIQSAEAQKIVFQDEFNEVKDWPVDTSKWVIETGGEGWGTNELQFYRSSNTTVFHDGEGNLVIKAKKIQPPFTYQCWYGPCQYTSARLKTKGKFETTYGRFEARIKIPRGNGIWPTF